MLPHFFINVETCKLREGKCETKANKKKKFVLSEPWFTYFFNHFPSFSGKNNNNNNKDHSPVTQYQPNEIFQRPFVFPVKKIREGLFFVQSKQPKPPSSNLDLVFSYFYLTSKLFTWARRQQQQQQQRSVICYCQSYERERKEED